MPSHQSFRADINEILVGWHALGSWEGYHASEKVSGTLTEKRLTVGEEAYEIEMGRAEIMSHEALGWARENMFVQTATRVWWTKLPGAMESALGFSVNSTTNPTDILLQFDNGDFLGISAKSTGAASRDIGFANPGAGTMDTELELSLQAVIELHTSRFIETHNLPADGPTRKERIRADAALIATANAARSVLLRRLADILFERMSSIDQNALRNHVLTIWLKAGGDMKPRYVKITGRGKKAPYTAKVSDPATCEKAHSVRFGYLQVIRLGNDSIGIQADGKRILKCRFKFASQAMASSIKLSGDPWTDARIHKETKETLHV